MPITRYDKMGLKKGIDLKFIVSQKKLYRDHMPITQYNLVRQIKNWYFRGT